MISDQVYNLCLPILQNLELEQEESRFRYVVSLAPLFVITMEVSESKMHFGCDFYLSMLPVYPTLYLPACKSETCDER